MTSVLSTGVLVIVPRGSASGGVAPTTRIAGLPLLRRTLLAATRAGFRQILLHPAVIRADRSLLAGTAAVMLTPNSAGLRRSPSRIVLLGGEVLPQVKWLRELREMPIEPDRLYTDGSSAAVIQTGEPDRVLAQVVRSDGACTLSASLGGIFKTADLPLNEEGRFILATPDALRRAEAWLLRGLVKEVEGFMSRHVERPISLAITRQLARTRITPNAMTLVSLGVGLLGAPFFLSAAPVFQLTGALLLLAHSILDGCDGELARLKFQESHWGSVLDFWGDNVVHVAVMACIALGWSRAVGARWPLAVGGVAVVSVLLTAGFVYRQTTEAGDLAGPLFPSGAGRRAWLPRLADFLPRRDFIYLVILLSALGKATWFLALAAVGTPLFLLLLVWIARAEAHRVGLPA